MNKQQLIDKETELVARIEAKTATIETLHSNLRQISKTLDVSNSIRKQEAYENVSQSTLSVELDVIALEEKLAVCQDCLAEITNIDDLECELIPAAGDDATAIYDRMQLLEDLEDSDYDVEFDTQDFKMVE
jgi:hypothetical protein